MQKLLVCALVRPGVPQAMPLWLLLALIALAFLALYFLIKLIMSIFNALGNLFGMADIPQSVWDTLNPVIALLN